MVSELKFELSSTEVNKISDDTYCLKLVIDNNYFLGRDDQQTQINLKSNKNIEITCSDEEVARVVAWLVDFRGALKDNSETTNDKGKWVIFMKGLKTMPSDQSTEVKLTNDDFEGGFGIEKINIGVAEENGKPWGITKNLQEYLEAWCKLTDLNLFNSQDFGVLPSISEIKDRLDFLNNFWIKKGETNESLEKKIYELTVNIKGLEHFSVSTYRELIDFGVALFSEIKVWKELGFDKVSEIKNAIKNGFSIGNKNFFRLDPNPEMKLGNGKLIEKQPDGTTENNDSKNNIALLKGLIKNKKFAGVKIDVLPSTSNDFKPKVEQLMHFCGKNWFGEKHDGVDYLSRTHDGDPRKTRGFKPNDIEETGNYGSRSENMSDGKKDVFAHGERCTKIAMDIWRAPNLEKAIDLAFFGKHYFIADLTNSIDKTVRLDERYKSGSESLLYFNEVSEWNEQETLDFYLSVISSDNCGKEHIYNEATNELTGGTTWINNNFDEINRIRSFAQGIVELYMEARNATTSVKVLEIKNKFEGYKHNNSNINSNEGIKNKLYEHWKGKFDALGKASVNYQAKRKQMLLHDDWKNEPYKTVLDSDYVKNGNDIIILNELEKLFNLLKGAYATPPTTVKSQLRLYSELNDNESDNTKKIQSELWKIIQGQKMGDSTKPWGKEAISKAKVGDLKDIRKRIKAKMDKVGGDVYDKIVNNNSEIRDDAEKLEQVEEIFDTSVLAWKEFKVNEYLFNKLSSFRNDVNRKTAWDAVNAYKKKWENGSWVDSTDGFAEGAFKNIEESVTISQKINEIYDQTDSVEVFITQLETFINGDKFKTLNDTKKKRFKEIIKLRLIAAKRIDIKKNQNDDEKKIVRLLRLDDLGINYKESKEAMVEIEKDLRFLKELKDANSGDKLNIRQVMGDNADSVLLKLIDEMDVKYQALKNKYQDSSDNSEQGGKGFLNNPWVIIVLIVVVLVVVGLIAYLMRNKNSEEVSAE